MTALTVTDNTVASSKATLSWSASVATDFYSYRIYWRGDGQVDWTLIDQIFVKATSSRDAYGFVAGPQEYALTVVTQDVGDGSLTEEAKSPTSFTPAASVGTGYRLIHPTTPSKSFDIGIVTSDSFDLEVEKVNIELIGRGRKVNVGSVWGYKISLSLQIRDHATRGTARAQKALLAAAHVAGEPMLLRNPFGDLWLVDIESISFDRVSAGLHEATDCDIEFVEVTP